MAINVIPSPPLTELQSFASWFHQDWKLMSCDFVTGTRMYVKTLPAARRAVLASELRAFVLEHAHSKPASINQRWIKLGAQVGWRGRYAEVRPELERMLEIVEAA